MADWPPKKNAAFTWTFFIRDADGDLVSGAAALDVESSGDGAAFADVAGAEVDEGEGNYSCPISAAEMNFDRVSLICKTGTAGAKTAAQVVYTATRQLLDLSFPASSGRSTQVETDGMVHADVKEHLGVAPNALLSGRYDASIGAMAAAVLTAAAIATDAITAAKIAAGAIGVSEAPNLDAAITTRATPAQVNTEVDTALADIHLDHLLAVDTPAPLPGVTGSILNDLLEDDAGIWRLIANALEQVWSVVTRDITGGTIDTIGTGGIVAGSFAAAAIDAAAIATDAIGSAEMSAAAAQKIADEILNRDIAGGGSGNTRNVRNALRLLRNKWSISAGTLTVTQEDDIAAAWTAAIATTAGDPISSVDPL